MRNQRLKFIAIINYVIIANDLHQRGLDGALLMRECNMISNNPCNML
jgi:hypothetical protein